MSDFLYYRIATTLAGLEKGANFFVLGLPPPNLPLFQPDSVRQPGGQGGERRHGYIQVSLLWLTLTLDQGFIIYDLITQAEATGGQGNGTLYLTVPRVDGSAGGVSWVDISGVALMPQFSPVQDSRGALYENVVLRLNNVTVEATPSTVVT